MAKSDFCFTYYDGDAASDMQHMNRLQRGAYSDILMFQRKLIQRSKSIEGGHFTIDQARDFLGKDFDSVWKSLELVLHKDAAGNFFIEWLEKSEIKAKKHSEKQSNNRKKETKPEPNETKQQPNNNLKKPLGDGDGDGNGFEEEKGVQGEKQEVVEIGKPNGHRVIIQSKYLHERPTIIHGSDGLKQHFTNTGQLDAIERAKWIDFAGFMENNPAAMFSDNQHLYNSFRNYHKKNINGNTNGKNKVDRLVTATDFGSL